MPKPGDRPWAFRNEFLPKERSLNNLVYETSSLTVLANAGEGEFALMAPFSYFL